MMNPPRLAALVLACASIAACGDHAIYVAPSGDDSNPGTRARPIATLREAQNRARAARAATTDQPVVVQIRGGTYPQTAALEFDHQDSGSPGRPVIYAAYKGEKVTISGGRRLTGTWRQIPGKPYHALDIPEAKDGKWLFHALYVNGSSRQRARKPNWDERVLRAKGRAHGEPPNKALEYYPGDIDPLWTDPQNIDVVQLCSWTPTLHKIKGIDADRRIVRFESAHARPVDFWEKRFRYYLVGVFEALDAPGEWYLNRQTGTLYYYPMPGEDIRTAEFIAPVVRSTLLHLGGDPANGRSVEHIEFRGIAFKHVDADILRHDGIYRQGHMFLGAAIRADGLRHSTLQDCEIAQVGEWGLELATGCQSNAIRQCHIWDTGAGGIQLGVTDLNTLKAAGATGRTTDNAIDNNFIHRTGTIWHGCYGIVNRFASRSLITHNEITDTHWTAIGLDARWDFRGEDYSKGNVVAFNRLHHLGLRYHTDAAGIYQFGPLDTHIHHNHIHHTLAYGGNCGYAGVYLDEQSRGALVENNLVHDVDWFAYFQHKGVDNVFRNNIGAFARDGLISRGSLNEHWKRNDFLAERNIYVTDGNQAIVRKWEPGERAPVLRANMYFSTTATNLSFCGGSFADWRALGQDADSVIGDPGFRDPAARDFTLAQDAPAIRAIGFQPFQEQIATAGLYGPPGWTGVPSQFAGRPPTPEWTPEEMDALNQIDFDFERDAVGATPDVFRVTEDTAADATIRVTDETAATGRKSLKITDAARLKKPFYPYLHATPKNVESGAVHMAFDVMLDPTKPCHLSFEMRDEKNGGASGVLMEFNPDGSILASRRKVSVTPPGLWTHAEIRFQLGPGAPKQYELAIRSKSHEQRFTLPFVNPSLTGVDWIGFCAGRDTHGAAYLDNVRFTRGD